MAECVEFGCHLPRERNNKCGLHLALERVKGLEDDLGEAISAANAEIEEARNAVEQFKDRVTELEAELAAAKENAP